MNTVTMQPMASTPAPVVSQNADKFVVRDLDFFYGTQQSLKSVNMTIPERR